MKKLESRPDLHDKIEFDIVYSCYTFDLAERLSALQRGNFSQNEIGSLMKSLKSLTNRMIDSNVSLLSQDLLIIEQLENRIIKIRQSPLDLPSKIYWLLEDCKHYGTLPFAGIARAAFIAVQILQSLVSTGILTEQDADHFRGSLRTVCSQMQNDRESLSKTEFLCRYGHLREGTYDILSPRYDEASENYFDWQAIQTISPRCEFTLSCTQIKKIDSALSTHGLNGDSASLFHFMRSAIEGREHSKFLFTKSLSEAISLIKQLGSELGFTTEECSYMDIQDINKLYSCGLDRGSFLKESILRGKKLYSSAQEVILPPLITHPGAIWAFDQKQTSPNYITLRKAIAPVHSIESESPGRNISGKILMIPSADPGYDWIFTYPIAGFITMYGGINSHMAIRATEIGIPAVIGAGEVLFRQWSAAKLLEIDCMHKIVRTIQ